MDFDRVSRNYADELDRGVRLSGENADYFAERRVHHVVRYMKRLDLSPESILEFGCGTGINLRQLRRAFPLSRIVGVDVSQAMLDATAEGLADPELTLVTVSELDPDERFDLVFVNGVFHHIPPAEQAENLTRTHAWLRSRGVLALFENNPFNPGARWVMSRIPFDKDASMLNPYRLATQLRELGFARVDTRFYHVFPGFLRAFRPVERSLERWPIGAQYCLYARR